MGNQAISSIAALVALTFLIMALAACASSEQVAPAIAAAPVAQEPAGVAEFHGAHIAGDALRDRLPSES